MKNQNIPWHNILWIYPKGPLYNWKYMFGEMPDLSSFMKRFLVTIDEFASSVICPDNDKCRKYCDRCIMWNGKTPEGACLKMLRPDLTLTPEDVKVYGLDTAAFHKAIAEAIGIEPFNSSCGDRFIWRIGSLAAKPGKRRSVFLTYRQEDSFLLDIPKVCMDEKEPIILLTFRHYDLPVKTEWLLNKYRIERFSLDELLEFKHDCQMKLLRSCANIWAGITESIKNEEKKQYQFNLPPGAEWEDISIHFQDKEKVSITIGGREKLDLIYHQMGMADKRNVKPTCYWHLLSAFAAGNGSFPCESPAANEKIRQQKLRLASHLCHVFGLQSDPIPWNKEAKAYVCRFKIRPDTESTIYHAKLRGEIKSAGEDNF